MKLLKKKNEARVNHDTSPRGTSSRVRDLFATRKVDFSLTARKLTG